MTSTHKANHFSLLTKKVFKYRSKTLHYYAISFHKSGMLQN